MKRYTIAIGAGVLISAASAFIFFGLGSFREPCAYAAKEPANVSLAKKAVREYRTSGAWDASIVCDVEKAKALLQNYKPAANKKPAVIFDIDDTALSNWAFIDISDFGYNHLNYKNWENSAQDVAIEPIKELYLLARQKGFAIFFITGRREVQRKFTERNLRKVGFDEWDGAFFKPMDYVGTSAGQFKTKWRTHIINMGYTLVLNIGDQQSDLDGEPQALYNIKIANPAYFIP